MINYQRSAPNRAVLHYLLPNNYQNHNHTGQECRRRGGLVYTVYVIHNPIVCHFMREKRIMRMGSKKSPHPPQMTLKKENIRVIIS